MFKNSSTFLVSIMFVVVHRFNGSGSSAASGFLAKVLSSRAVGSKNAVNDSHPAGIRFKHYSSSTVSKNNTSGSVFVIDNGRHFISTHYNYFFIFPSLDELTT